MIPVRLQLRNFMSYGEIHDPLELEGIHVAVLSGENGAGKSTLIDAITWVLWGQSRARTTDDLIHTGATEMEVDFEFRLADNTYRVIRKRTVARSSATLLDLSVRDGDSFRSISGNTIRDTEAKIEHLLRMSYSTFTSSSLILQGRADSFTRATPAERKQVLADILELDEYDRLQERARREAQAREARQRELEQQIREAESELDRREEFRDAHRAHEQQIRELDVLIQHTESELVPVQSQIATLEAVERDLSGLADQVQGTRSTCDRLERSIRDAATALGSMKTTLDRADQVEADYARLRAAREADQALNLKRDTYTTARTELATAEAAIESRRGLATAELAALQERAARARAQATELSAHTAAVERARATLADLARLQERKSQLERRVSGLREQMAELRGSNERLRGEMQSLRGRIDVLESNAICPICRSELDDDGRAALVQQYTAEGLAQKATFQDNARRATELEGQTSQLQADLSRIAVEIEQSAGAERALAGAEQSLAAARAAQEELATIDPQIAARQRVLETGELIAAEQAETDRIRARITALDYDERTHREVRAQMQSLAYAEEQERELQRTRQAMAHRQESVERDRTALMEWQAKLQADSARLDLLRTQIAELPEVRRRAQRLAESLAEHRQNHGLANRRLGEARQRLAYLDQLERQTDERRVVMKATVSERSLYTELATAFGKNGIQAMLIETAIPDIQDEANRLLGIMTQGRMHVAMQTQRSRRGSDGTIETLDIVIHDELGDRPYEMYSGGEAFRVNFAIRIALSRLLARRAGARLQTLVIDEGFGSQDEEGRERLVEAIQGVADEFEKILVITHLDDLKDRFPVRIDVRKTALGSVFEVQWLG
ncbi:MAG: SMC family ATPase [Chloroflexota bacterium]